LRRITSRTTSKSFLGGGAAVMGKANPYNTPIRGLYGKLLYNAPKGGVMQMKS